MSLIKVDIGGKGVGLADQASVDVAKGCKNNCVGCYAAKTSRLGSKFSTLEIKEYDDVEFRKSCRSAVNKGIKFARLGKHTDCGDDSVIGTTNKVLKAAADEGLRLVFVTKSLQYSVETAKLISEGDHILHVSRGMITDGPSDADRAKLFIKMIGPLFSKNICQRVIADVTKECEFKPGRFHMNTGDAPHIWGTFHDRCIVTPMRFPSKDILEKYEADIKNYEFKGGFYRPKFIHESWNVFDHWCGEVGDTVMCCNCLVEKETKNGKKTSNKSS